MKDFHNFTFEIDKFVRLYLLIIHNYLFTKLVHRNIKIIHKVQKFFQL